MHNAAFAAAGLNWCYVAFPTGRARLGDALRGLVALGAAGANITVPHKEAALAYLDDVADEARAIGAVNTVRVDGERLVGYNTDGAGLLDALRLDAGLTIDGALAVIVGAGGAARAAAFALAAAAASVVIANRNWDRAATLAADVRRAFPGRPVDAVPLDGAAIAGRVREATVLVQATTVGSGAQRDELPVTPGALHPDLFVMDMVYEPRDTALLRAARARGCRTLEGLPMLVYQGARAFEIWTGRAAPVDVMRRAVGLLGDPPAARVGGQAGCCGF